MILRYRGYFIEIQLRTISMDTWAALEHQMKYKKKVNGNVELISSELKRCADDLASTDISMETLRNLIRQMEDE
jgi:ppGpp synthetase/RelA/SpoT-type nucleotidyltranferase